MTESNDRLWSLLGTMLKSAPVTEGNVTVTTQRNGEPKRVSRYRATNDGGQTRWERIEGEAISLADAELAERLADLRRRRASIGERRSVLSDFAARLSELIADTSSARHGPPSTGEVGVQKTQQEGLSPNDRTLLVSEIQLMFAENDRKTRRTQVLYLIIGLAASIPLGLLINTATAWWNR